MINVQRFDSQNSKEVRNLIDLYHDETAAEFFRRIPADLSPAQVQNIETITGSTFYTLTEGSDEIVGFAVACELDPYCPSCHLGLILKKNFRGSNYSEWCTKAIIQFMFEKSNIHKISFRILSHRRDIDKNFRHFGLQLEGVFHESVFWRGEWQTEFEYAVLRPNYKEIICRS